MVSGNRMQSRMSFGGNGWTGMSAVNNLAAQHEREVATGKRFRFGRNWARFLKRLNQARIAESEKNLMEFLGKEALEGKAFLDVGSGSGLSSLAARRLGAAVTSFDYDGQSVACTEELRRRYLPDDPSWTIEHGSVTLLPLRSILVAVACGPIATVSARNSPPKTWTPILRLLSPMLELLLTSTRSAR